MSGEHVLRERAELLDELHDIVQAMKNVAFAELQRVNRELPALGEACDAVTQALHRLPVDADPPARGTPRRAVAPATCLVIGAERGFCGAFNARLAAALAQWRQAEPAGVVLVASRRLLDLMGPTAEVTALPGCAAVEDGADALESWLDAVGPIVSRPAAPLWLLHHAATGPRCDRLWPLAGSGDAGGTKTTASDLDPPLHHLPWPALRDALQRQALRLRLQAALYESLAQENHSRLTQMQLAQDHLDELGRTLRRRRSALRQAEITNELETLVSALPGRPTPHFNAGP